MSFVQKEVELQLHLIFTVTANEEEEAKEDCGYFMQWVREQFTQWDDSILQYFLYEYGLTQDGKYTLDLHIDKVIDNDAQDETVSASGHKPKKDGDKNPEDKGTDIDEMHEVNEDNMSDLMDQALDAQHNEPVAPEPGVARPTNIEVSNPMEQMQRLVKKKKEKRKEND